jgi:P27 family predicted phage terminase small subunit
MRGRKPKPTKLRLIEGNPGKRAINRDEPKPDNIKPDMPSDLSKEAQNEWIRICEDLDKMGLLSRADSLIIVCLSQAEARRKRGEIEVAKSGEIITTVSGNVIQNPWLGVVNRAMDQIKAFSVELGLTPSARSRLHTTEKKPINRRERLLG